MIERDRNEERVLPTFGHELLEWHGRSKEISNCKYIRAASARMCKKNSERTW